MDDISYEVADGIATITLNRPERLNAVSHAMVSELTVAIDEIDADDAVRVAIVTGAGRAFCVGADLSAGVAGFGMGAGSRSPDDGPRREAGGVFALRAFECRTPIIAAINGHAIGFGITMTLPMDLRIVSEDAKIGFPFAARGVVPEACASWFLPRMVGMQQAAEWIYTGEPFSAHEALAAGLVRSVHPAGEVLAEAHRLAHRIARNAAPVSVALCRTMLWRSLVDAHPIVANRVEGEALRFTSAAPDAAEGVVAFLEKRPPRWTMRPSVDLPDVTAWWDDAGSPPPWSTGTGR